MLQQISPPLRIALAAVVVLAALWFVALRPKGASEEAAAPPPVAPGVQGLTSDVQKARDAKEAADASAARTGQAAANAEGGQAATPAALSAPQTSNATAAQTSSGGASSGAEGTNTGSAAKATSASGSSAAPLVDALAAGDVVILTFRNRSADSAAVAAAVRRVPRRGGKVVVRVASVSDVGRYRAFTGRTQVNQAPTTFVIGPTKRAKVIVGFTTTGEISQSVGDMLVAARRAAAKN